MARNIDNSWTSSANYIDANSKTRTNPYANDGGSNNAVELYGIETYGTRFQVGFSWAVTSGGDQLAFTPTSGSSATTDYFKFRVTDMNGNEAYGAASTASPTNAVNVDTSGLDPDDTWEVIFSASQTQGTDRVQFAFKIGTGAIYGNSSASVGYTF